MGICDSGYTTGSKIDSCRTYKTDIKYSKVYCNSKRDDLIEKEKAPSGFREIGIVKAPTECIKYCFGDFIKKVPRYRKKYERVYSSKNKLDCCLGKLDSESKCHPNWCWENDECDTVVRNYCATKEGQKDPRCGCLLPQDMYKETKLLGPPECVDVRCAGNPQAYRIKRQRTLNCPDIVNCSIGNITITGTDSNIDLKAIRQQCGSEFAEEVQKKLEEAQNPTNGPSNSNGPTNGNGNDNSGVKIPTFLDETANQLGISTNVLIGGSATIIILSIILVFLIMRKKKTQ